MMNGGHLRRAKGTGTVRLRADGRYEGRITVDGVRRGVYAYSQAEVEALLAQLRGTPPPTHRSAAHPARMTTHRATVQALDDARRLGLSTDDTARLVLSSTRPGRVARGIYGPCAYCGEIYASSVDHVIPTSRGGPDEASNLVSACVRCNGVKGNRTPEEWGQPPEG